MIEELLPEHRDKKWRDREGDIWRYSETVGWCYSRNRPNDQVLDEPGIPSHVNGPYSEFVDNPDVAEILARHADWAVS